ncbi:hypothetical protein TNCV_3300761 [Trichonephila clavipes]|nr:hypothetical protein TNCV_3300761 [Trichonephila clavipes]
MIIDLTYSSLSFSTPTVGGFSNMIDIIGHRSSRRRGLWTPSDHERGLQVSIDESRVRVLEPIKTRHVEWLMHVKSAMTVIPGAFFRLPLRQDSSFRLRREQS